MYSSSFAAAAASHRNKWRKGSKRRPSVHCACHCSHITVKMKSPNVSNCDLGIEPTNQRHAKKDAFPSFILGPTWLNKQRKWSSSSRFTGQSAKLDWLKNCCWISGDGFLRSYSPLSRIFIAAGRGQRRNSEERSACGRIFLGREGGIGGFPYKVGRDIGIRRERLLSIDH